MNLMFRKNFSGEKSVSSSGGGGKARGALGAGRNAKRQNRERYSCMEEHHYRTHLFFSAPRASAQYNEGSGKKKCILGSKRQRPESEFKKKLKAGTVYFKVTRGLRNVFVQC